VTWANNLAVDGSIQVAPTTADYPTNISYTISGNTLTITWPETHMGWILQGQTNSVEAGLTTNWHDILSTTNITSIPVNIDPANPSVFYRLRHP
jgi:hypothetical protein